MIQRKWSIGNVLALLAALLVVTLPVIGTRVYERISGSVEKALRVQRVSATENQQVQVNPAPAVGETRVSPRLDMYSPREGDTVRPEGIQVIGVTEPSAKVRIKVFYDGDRDSSFPDVTLITAKSDGSFSQIIPVPRRPVGGIEVSGTVGGSKVEKVIRLYDPAAILPSNPRELLVKYFGREYYYIPWRGVRDYYSDDGLHYKKTKKGLKTLINDAIERNRLFPEYKANYFDCSNASAMMWQLVTDAGFNAVIALGPFPPDPSKGDHAWVIVHCEDGDVALEAAAYTEGRKLAYEVVNTTPGPVPVIVEWLVVPGGFIERYEGNEGYFKPRVVYPSVYDAVRSLGNANEWDWWSKIK